MILDRENQKKKEGNAKSSWWGWITGSSQSNSGDEHANDSDETESIHMTEEQKKELYEAIEYDEEKAKITSAMNIPKDVLCIWLYKNA